MIDSNNCAGCGACENVCPQKAISLNNNNEQCLVAQIDLIKCIGCNLCNQVCLRLNPRSDQQYQQKVFGAYNKDLYVRTNSTSGGVFSSLAECIINQGGYVVGVVMEDNQEAHFTITNKMEELTQYRKSKYVQAFTGDIYQKIELLLTQGNTVFFTGLPCQVHALKLFLKKEYNNLFCADLLCFGEVPPKIFSDYIEYKQNKTKKKIVDFCFRGRDEVKGWHKMLFCAAYDDGTEEIIRQSRDYYYGLYFKNIAIRESCFTCKYKTQKREGDITLGDFWGIDKVDPEFDSNDGISLVMVNSAKGERLFSSISDQIEKREYDLCVLDYNQTKENNKPYKFRKNFFKLYNRYGFAFACFWHVTVFRVLAKVPLVNRIYK